ncbi:hypothetical protein BN1221_00793c [Brenneria goodwinii]|uniref:Uncharacterized protein n=1 Tax=Brenneria goodwinii TaxID=1109412 RepID=A0A0G4JR30_9GAMM|nr:hypothetical protein BN1221_00793c [Brenneria goodwinii]
MRKEDPICLPLSPGTGDNADIAAINPKTLFKSVSLRLVKS